MTGFLPYEEIQRTVNSGALMVFASGTVNGVQAVAWLACAMDRRATEIAYSESPTLRAAQAVGVLSEVRRHAQRQGFIPARPRRCA